MNKLYTYKDTFSSLLSLIKYLSTFNIKNINIKNDLYTPNLLEREIFLDINTLNIEAVIINDIGIINFNVLFYLYLSNEKNKENIMYYFYLNALRYKDTILKRRNLNCVTEANRIIKYVKGENHKFKGFVRFKELNSKILYSEINPTNNILPILSIHFKNRLKEECWIIKDVNRNIYALYDKKAIQIVNVEKIPLNVENLSNTEIEMETMWKTFYNTIGIEERKNNRCRMNFMPKKYWKYILEVGDINEESN